jgi:hypothetical protein
VTTWTVAEGASLTVTDANLRSVTVNGTFLARRVSLGNLISPGEGDGSPLLDVGVDGSALVTNAVLYAYGAPTASNAGVLVLHGTTIRLAQAPGPASITTQQGGQTRLSATAALDQEADAVVAVCAGVAPTSYGYNLVPDSTCGLATTGDRQDFVDATENPDDERVDAIPVGTLHCGDGWDDDVAAQGVRPLDGGDPDQVAACDVGAFEARPPD